MQIYLNTGLRWRKESWNASLSPTLTSTTDHHLCAPPESFYGLGVECDEEAGVGGEGKGEEGKKDTIK